MNILMFHITVALLGVMGTAATWIYPSMRKLKVVSVLIAATIASGTYLVINRHAPLMSSCITGLVYLALTAPGLLLGRRKLHMAAVLTR